MRSLKSLARNVGLLTIAVALLGVSAFWAPKALSQEPVSPTLPSGEYVVPDAIDQGYEQQPDYGYSPYAGGRAFPQRVYWGDTHLHTYYSFDAGAAGTRLTPEDAYRLARGEEVTTNTGQQIRLSRPFDFLVVTDHSDSLGAIVKFIEGTPEILANPQTRAWHEAINQGGEAASAAMNEIVSGFAQGLDPEVLRITVPTEAEYQSFWDAEIEAAERFNTPGFFTAFIGYEWTSLVTGDNLHRNVIYRDNGDKARQLLPKTAETEQDPETLWAWMQNYEDQTGGQVLAIPHNGNLSNGLMFAETTLSGTPLTADYAERRQRWEPVYEVTQMKGDGETHPFLSPTDEFADFETWDKGNLDLTEAKEEEMLAHEYARSALRLGLGLEQSLGTNPFKFGMVGSTDSHTGMSAMEENNFFGKFPNEEPRPERYDEIVLASPDRETRVIQGWELQAAGIAGVWARENTREALFDAFQRREVYASTGPRMSVRLFGGWDFTEADALSRSLADVGYAKGVPMGGDLSNAPGGAALPLSWRH